ncbi:MAG: Gfo/Idh/MocA family oxidoreductase [Rhodothermales bacterium]|nr:Gfo/Idh/MocA family oxidoreductase [Rhodothermales bacterium]MBO6779775.1 Gfo/Idh/MocA family oxidoreductase [Rhodothermales bacterium]
MPLTRRRFAALAAASPVFFTFPEGLTARGKRSRGPSDTLNFGAIGIRGMGNTNTRSLLRHDGVRCLALCDVDRGVLESRGREVEEATGHRPALYDDYRSLLEHPDLDFVVIGTPDHWHPIMTLDAVDAGLHAYVEKPLANSIGEADVTHAGVRRSGKLVQVGQWQRSSPHWQDAMAFVHSGALGNIRTVKTWAYQGWMKPVPVVQDSAVPMGVNYDAWLGPAAERPFNANRFHFNFRWFWDYAGGLMTDWGVHILDFALLGMNAGFPRSVMASGGKFAYPDDASETPDTLQAVFEFDGFTMLWEHATGIDLGPYRRTHGVAFIGNNGTLVVDRGGWEVIPEEEDDAPLVQVPAIAEYEGSDIDRHTGNFLSAIRESTPLAADIGVGHHVAVVAHMGNVAFKTGRKVHWDRDAWQFRNDEEANRLKAGIPYRDGYVLPSF